MANVAGDNGIKLNFLIYLIPPTLFIVVEIITNINQLDKYKSRALVNLKCKACDCIFQRTKKRIQEGVRYNNKIILTCSQICKGKLKTINNTFIFNCKQCNVMFTRRNCERRKNNFCSQSCGGKYNSTHKTHGTRRSKLEKWLEIKLREKYPHLEFHFNRKDTINSELDIYIPSFKLAFELNGIFHYEPIYGLEKLNIIQNNDQRKFQACLEHGIEFCIIDTSKQKYFKEKTSQQFLNIITNIIDNKLKT